MRKITTENTEMGGLQKQSRPLSPITSFQVPVFVRISLLRFLVARGLPFFGSGLLTLQTAKETSQKMRKMQTIRQATAFFNGHSKVFL